MGLFFQTLPHILLPQYCTTICQCPPYFLLIKDDSQKIPIFKMTQAKLEGETVSDLEQVITMTHHCVNMNHIPLGEFFAFLFQRDKYLTHLPHLTHYQEG